MTTDIVGVVDRAGPTERSGCPSGRDARRRDRSVARRAGGVRGVAYPKGSYSWPEVVLSLRRGADRRDPSSWRTGTSSSAGIRRRPFRSSPTTARSTTPSDSRHISIETIASTKEASTKGTSRRA